MKRTAPFPLRILAAFTLRILTAFTLLAASLAPAIPIAEAANPSASLDQCANGSSASPNAPACNPNEWVNGNLGASKANYFEGNSVPYRLRFDNLTTGASNPHNVTIEWDTTKSGKHALDYLTTFDRTVTTADPCSGVSGCNPASFSTTAIPQDPQVTGARVTPIAGEFRLYGGTITTVSAYAYPNGTGFTGDKTARLTVTFTASVKNPVLAWGGHISTRLDWGATGSAVTISGSPFHTRLIDLDGAGGNQDRSLSNDAVIFPASITVIKDAVPNDAQDFSFTASPAPLSNFSLDDDADSTLSNTKRFDNITTFTTYTVAEAAVAGWALTNLACAVAIPNGGSQTPNLATRSVSINLKEGENVTCTFTNTAQRGTLIVKKHVVNDNGGTKQASDFTIRVTGSSPNPASFPGNENGTTVTLNAGSYSVDEGTVAGYAKSLGADCSGTIAGGETKTCIVTNNDVAPTLTLVKTVTNNNGGTKQVGDFPLFVDGNQVTSGVANTVSAGAHTASERTLPGYTPSGWGGDCAANGTITLALGDNKTCTITNADQAPSLAVQKRADSAIVSAGNPIGFTITVSNSSAAGTARDVTLADPLPVGPGLNWGISPAYSGPGTCQIVADSRPGQKLACDFGDLAPGASASVHVSSSTTGESVGSYANTVTVQADNHPRAQDGDSVLVKAAPGISTTQDFIPNDSATLTGGTSAAGGTITFNLYAPPTPGGVATCAGRPAYTSGALTVSGADNKTYSTSNTTFHATTAGTWKWQVVYSGDDFNAGMTTGCGVEQFTINNNATP